MMNYMDLIRKFYPGTEASCDHDPYVYSNIVFSDEVIAKTDLDNKLLDHQKIVKNEEIDKRTRELIAQGFTHNSVVFSASDTAQRNWLALAVFGDNLTFPVKVTTIDDQEYSFTDSTEILTFAMTGMGTVSYHYNAGRALKLLVNAATDIVGINSVQDDR